MTRCQDIAEAFNRRTLLRLLGEDVLLRTCIIPGDGGPQWNRATAARFGVRAFRFDRFGTARCCSATWIFGRFMCAQLPWSSAVQYIAEKLNLAGARVCTRTFQTPVASI